MMTKGTDITQNIENRILNEWMKQVKITNMMRMYFGATFEIQFYRGEMS